MPVRNEDETGGGGGGGGITFDLGTPIGVEGLIRTGPSTIGIGEAIISFKTRLNGGDASTAKTDQIIESGTEVTAIRFDWEYSTVTDPIGQNISLLSAPNITGAAPSPGSITPTSLRTDTESPLTMNITAAPTGTTTKATYQLGATFAAGATSANVTIKYKNRRYFGVAPAAGGIISTGAAAFAAFSASAEFCDGTPVTKTFDCSAGAPPNRMYICWPASFPNPTTVLVGGFSVSNYTINTSSLTNASGFAENYKILVVPNDGSGTSSASITVQLT